MTHFGVFVYPFMNDIPKLSAVAIETLVFIFKH